ncbi:MAG: hypothetical protein GY878_15920 [Fuerstiella sp.]|nr:hypothetical protein [Fuerstiella sp.]
MVDAGDAHLLPEILLDQQEGEPGNRWAILNTDGGGKRTKRLNALAKLAPAPGTVAEARLRTAASSDDAAMRWWAITGLSNQKSAKGVTVKSGRYLLRIGSPLSRGDHFGSTAGGPRCGRSSGR